MEEAASAGPAAAVPEAEGGEERADAADPADPADPAEHRPARPPGELGVVRLHPGRDKALRHGHPWIFSGAVAAHEGPAGAPLVEVFSAAGERLGLGFWSPRSQIRVRMLGPGIERAGHAFFAARLAAASALRRVVVPPETTGYRLLNAEGDGVPGWTLDRFGDVLVSQITVAGLEAQRDEAYRALRELVPASSILQLNALPARRAEGLPARPADSVVVAGQPPPEAGFTESGLRFVADLEAGQKTGFYCDQRENRRLAGRLAAGRSVLDLFAHTGAFGVYALAGGAGRVVHVESSARAIERGRRHYELNRLDAGRVEWVKADVWLDLRARQERYDLILCDPPPLVRKRQDLEAAARAYKDLNRLAFSRLAPGGMLLTFTCSGAVDARLFRQILFAAGTEAGARVGLLAQLGAAPDHPISLAHPEGEYLKGWLCVRQEG